MDIDVLDRIKKFTTDERGWIGDHFDENTALEADLKIYGDDAVEYMIAFGKEFGVDVSKFMAADYFSPEGGLVLLPGLGKLLGIKKEPKPKELTIGHLIKAVEAGRLDEEVINS